MSLDITGPEISDAPDPHRGRPPLLVLHVLEAVRGGTSRHVSDIVRHATDVDHLVAVSEPGGDTGSGARYDHRAVEAMRRYGARVIQLPMHRTPWHPANAVAVGRLRRVIALEQPAVVHGHSSVGGALARLAATGRRVPVVYTANGVAPGRPYVAAERALGRLTDRWIAVSASEADTALRLGLTPPAQVAIIANGIDLRPPAPAADLRAQLGIQAGTPLVGTVARLVPQKAPERFVRVAAEVARRHTGVHFVLVGMGPLQGRIDDEVEQSGLRERWHQLRHLDDAASALAQLDVFVLASQFEGAPYTPLEAMRAGTPVVLSDVVGNRDVVQDGTSGFLRPPDDTSGMAAAVVRLLTDDRLRRRTTEQAAERLSRNFDATAMGRRLGELYAGVALGSAASRRNTRRLPQPLAVSSTHPPDSIAAQ